MDRLIDWLTEKKCQEPNLIQSTKNPSFTGYNLLCFCDSDTYFNIREKAGQWVQAVWDCLQGLLEVLGPILKIFAFSLEKNILFLISVFFCFELGFRFLQKFTIDWLGASFSDQYPRSDQYAQKKVLFSQTVKSRNSAHTGNKIVFFFQGSYSYVRFTWAGFFWQI